MKFDIVIPTQHWRRGSIYVKVPLKFNLAYQKEFFTTLYNWRNSNKFPQLHISSTVSRYKKWLKTSRAEDMMSINSSGQADKAQINRWVSDGPNTVKTNVWLRITFYGYNNNGKDPCDIFFKTGNPSYLFNYLASGTFNTDSKLSGPEWSFPNSIIENPTNGKFLKGVEINFTAAFDRLILENKKRNGSYYSHYELLKYLIEGSSDSLNAFIDYTPA